jgi:hypothetical protein
MVDGKIKIKFLLASVKLKSLNNFENPFSNPLQRTCSGNLAMRMHAGSRLNPKK